MAKPKAHPKTKKSPARAKTPLPSAADYIRMLKDGKRTVASADSFPKVTKRLISSESIPTGSLALDRLLGGGWPVGGIIEVASQTHVGKSTLLDQSMAHCQRMGGVASLIDMERARSVEYTKTLGVDVPKLISFENPKTKGMPSTINRA